MAESFLDTCWDANDEEVASNGSDADVQYTKNTRNQDYKC